MKIHLVIFHTKVAYGQNGFYDSSIERLSNSFLKYGGDFIHVFNDENITGTYRELKFLNDNKLEAFGHYAFKPLVLLNVMSGLEEDDIILYHDAGRPQYNFEFRSDLKPLITKVVKHYQGLGLSNGMWPHSELTRDYCFKAMGCDTPYIRKQMQLAANWGIYQKNEKVLRFLEDWKSWCFEEEVVRTEKKDEINHANFKAHRWDQSILTNLYYLYSHKTVPDTKLGWEKDINNFTDDTSFIKVAKTFSTPEGITLIYDVLYRDNKLVVFCSGAVDNIVLKSSKENIQPTKVVRDPHYNVHRFEFNVDYSRFIEFEISSTEYTISFRNACFIIEKDYYDDTDAKHVISIIIQAGRNSVESILTFVKYHLNLGVDKIVIHENGGRAVIDIYKALLPYIIEGKVNLYCLKHLEFYQKLRPKSNPPAVTNVGEVFHMNHTAYLFKNSKYLTCLNVDELIVPPKGVKNLNNYLDSIITEEQLNNFGGINIRPNDFAPPSSGQYYTSKTLIRNVNNYPKLVYFPKNVEVITVHGMTVSKPPFDIPQNLLCFNHYPFLDRKDRSNFTNSIGELDNIDLTLFL